MGMQFYVWLRGSVQLLYNVEFATVRQCMHSLASAVGSALQLYFSREFMLIASCRFFRTVCVACAYGFQPWVAAPSVCFSNSQEILRHCAGPLSLASDGVS